MTALLSAVGRTGLSAAVMILAVMTLRVWFQERTPRRVFCLLWDLTLVRLLVLAELPSPVSIRRRPLLRRTGAEFCSCCGWREYCRWQGGSFGATGAFAGCTRTRCRCGRALF